MSLGFLVFLGYFGRDAQMGLECDMLGNLGLPGQSRLGPHPYMGEVGLGGTSRGHTGVPEGKDLGTGV